MIIHWPQLVVALLLLWLPRQVLRLGGKVLRLGSRRRTRNFHDTNPAVNRDPGDASLSLRDEIVKARNLIDFFRAALGTVALLGTYPGVDPAWEVAEPGASWVFYLQIGVLFIGVLVQTIRIEGRFALFAPIFYFSGVALGTCGVYPTLFALVLVWTINLALPNAAAFLTVYALLVATFGLLFDGLGNLFPFVTAGLMFLPVLLSLLLRRRLATFTKRVKQPAGPKTA